MNRNAMKSLQALLRSRMVSNGQGAHRLSTGAVISRNSGRCQQTLSRHTNFAQTARYYNGQATGPAAAAAISATTIKDGNSVSYMRTKAPTDWEKKILVWYGKYPTVDEVPKYVTSTSLNRAKDKFRAYLTVALIAATFAIGLGIIFVDHRANYKKHHPELQGVSK